MKNNVAKFLNLTATMGSPIRLFDSNGNRIYCEDINGLWYKREFDSNNNKIYYEDSNGQIIDNRPKTEYTIAEIEKLIGKKNIKIIK